jgi:hypothetical protein
MAPTAAPGIGDGMAAGEGHLTDEGAQTIAGEATGGSRATRARSRRTDRPSAGATARQ